MSGDYKVVDKVSRETAQHLEPTDATVAYYEERDEWYVLERPEARGDA